MAASYPAGFDTMSDPSTNLSGPPLHSTMHNQINDVVEAIEAELGLNPSGTAATVAAAIALTAWTAVTYTNSWVDGSGIQVMQYRKVGDVVQIRGGMRNGTIGAVAFTLPVGFRPPVAFDCLVLGAAAAAGFYWTIASTGTVTPTGASNTLSEVSGIISFSTIT